MSLLVPVAIAAVPGAAGAKVVGRGSVEQVQVTGATPGPRLRAARPPRAQPSQPQRAGALGGVVFRDVKPGARLPACGAAARRSAPLRVLSRRSAPPSTALYGQKIPATATAT